MALSARLRLRGSRCFDYLYQNGRIYHGEWIVLRVALERREYLRNGIRNLPTSLFRCSVVVSTKVSKSSVRRNAIRRLLHQYLQEILLRQSIPPLNPGEKRLGHWLLLSLKPGCSDIDPRLLRQDCLSLLTKAELQL
uniref:Bacterial ribonuclease P protein component of ribozyme n=1 Tax=Paulinella micropora TaxID=1928728 RepID=A0A385I134_9EUKA|nr:bacterial ribonuclease P protein component of ribozyme [Paulinella micropora]AXY63639.1 bacterial ribonuclease P protein component of ribozyme [Paulinella micropora]